MQLQDLEARVVMSAIPALNSLAGAAATLYLDFDGHVQSSWGSYSNITTPAYDQDGDPSSFSASEIASITRIWEYVAEDYAPFAINVTTVEPSRFVNGRDLRVVIGGNGSWTGGTYGGIAYRNSFTSSTPSVAFVFPKNLSNGSPKPTADAASHEAGHAFGLAHQSKYGSTGALVETYSTGTDGGKTAPLMGNSYSARRSLWWSGTTSSAAVIQDDMAVIASTTNGFGYRADDHGNTAATATPLTISGSTASGSGIIGRMNDLDAFSFTTGGGAVSFTVSTPAEVNNLAPRLELRDAAGSTVIASASSTSTFTATVGADLAAGSYRIIVAGDGSYGNVGQYFVNGSIVASSDAINAPSGLSASTLSTSRIDLRWADNASNETGYRVERSADGATWTVLAGGLAANSTSFSDTTASAGTTYTYRVQAYNASAASDYSGAASATTITLAPSGLSASAASSSRIDLRWDDAAGASSYRVERSTDGTTWTLAGTTGAGVTSFGDTGRAAGTTYFYRVQAVNSGGSSAFSATASATTPAAPRIPDAPTGLTATAAASTRVDLTWTDVNGETGYRIERSANGGKGWSTIARVGADATSFTDASVSAGKSYLYRVYAVNGSGESPASNTASVTTPSAAKGGGSNGSKGSKGGPSNGQGNAPGGDSASIDSNSIRLDDDSLAFGCGCSACTAATAPTPALEASAPIVAARPRIPVTFVADPSAVASPTPTPSPIPFATGSASEAVDLALENLPRRRNGPGGAQGRPWWSYE